MRITVPPLEISKDDGFKNEIDIFNRKPFGESLTNLLVNTDESIVTALDSPWGTGKSTFIKMWRGYLKEQEIKSILFDAFSNDYQPDPFLAIVSQILNLIEDDDIKEKIKDRAVKTTKVISRVGIKVVIKALTLGVLDGSEIDDTDLADDISEGTSEAVDKYISSQLLSVEKDKKTIESFKQTLGELSVALGTEKPIIFIIDELDRCKPQFAVETLEKIKHLFDVPNIKFVLVMNRPQIEEAIKGVYGQGVDATKYIQKFISLWTTFPKKENNQDINHEIYIKNSLNRMNLPYESTQEEAVNYLIEFSQYFNLTFREINLTLTNFAIVQNTRQRYLNLDDQMLTSFLSIIKVIRPTHFIKLRNSEIDYQNLVSELSLEELNWSGWIELGKPETHPIKYILKFALLSGEDRRDYANDIGYHFLGQNNFSSFNSGEIERICNWIDLFNG